MNRTDSIRQVASTKGVDAVLISFLPDVRWACGFTGSNGLLLVLPSTVHFVTDGRYRTQACQEIHDAEIDVDVAPGNLYDRILERGLLEGADSVLVQADHLSMAEFESLRVRWPDHSWVAVAGLLAQYVAAKTPDEVEHIQRAQQLTEQVFESILGVIRPGTTEREIAAEIVYRHLKGGAQSMSFEPIVASGPNGALPHARPTDREIRTGDLVVLDVGCYLDGYASDMTRTIAVGDPGSEARKVYQTVLEAQQAALSVARAGIPATDLDGAARSVIGDAGYGEYFSHSLGHGVGLQVHEWPRIAQSADYPLPLYAAVTIEPGIYIPREYGVRIEDIVVLQEDGCRNLTSAPKDLIIL
ncbi:MAG TPA: aminopeptidase P family protein [Rhodothermales bacterium]|nr:aminopeptidase P family protein [Rhodothermales bacterium]